MAKDLLVSVRARRRAVSPTSEMALITRARGGDAKAYEELVTRFSGLVRAQASSYFLAGGEADDLVQEGMLGLFKAVQSFDVERHAEFGPFARKCVEHQVINAVTKARRQKHQLLNSCESLDGWPTTVEMTLSAASSRADPASEVILADELEQLKAYLSAELSTLESRVLVLYLDGRSHHQIGEIADCDAKAVHNALTRVKRKVGAHLRQREMGADDRGGDVVVQTGVEGRDRWSCCVVQVKAADGPSSCKAEAKTARPAWTRLPAPTMP